MKVLPSEVSYSKIQRELGDPFSWLAKLKLKGVGSSKVIYVGGSEALKDFQSSSQSLTYAQFEIWPQGLVVRYSQGTDLRTMVIAQQEIHQMVFKSIKNQVVLNKDREVVQEKLVDASFTIALKDHTELTFYVPNSFYSAQLDFWKKSWLKEVVVYSTEINEESIEINSNMEYIWVRILKLLP